MRVPIWPFQAALVVAACWIVMGMIPGCVSFVCTPIEAGDVSVETEDDVAVEAELRG